MPRPQPVLTPDSRHELGMNSERRLVFMRARGAVCHVRVSSGSRYCSSTAAALHWQCTSSAAAVQQHCSSIALAVYQHCSSIALAVYQQCSSSAATLHQHCTGSVPAVPGTLFLQHLCGLSPMAVVLVATNDPAQSQTLLTRQCYIA